MIKSEGYKAFHGTATIRPVNPAFPARDETGDWLYKPEWDCWYVNGSSYPAKIVTDIREESELVSELKQRLNALKGMMVDGENIEAVCEMISSMEAWIECVKVGK